MKRDSVSLPEARRMRAAEMATLAPRRTVNRIRSSEQNPI
jgi:hypothetical protein